MKIAKDIFIMIIYVSVVFMIIGTIKNYICVPFIK